MGKIPIKSIKTITFTAGRQTKARRTEPIPQLSCVGKACRAFQPDVVQCTNMGDDDEGNIQWRCDTDLPPGFRLGRVEVSCEGWSKPGDKMINQGSCALEYNLYQSDPGLYDSTPSMRSRTDRLLDKGFALLFWIVTLILLYTLLRAIINRLFPRYSLPHLSSFFPPSDGPGHGHHHGWGGGPGPGPGGPGFNNGPAPPPPYAKNPPDTQTAGSGPGLGLWTGLAAGGLAGWLLGRQGTGTQTAPRAGPSQVRQRPRRSLWDDEDTGAGPSQPREMRRATGFGGTTIR